MHLKILQAFSNIMGDRDRTLFPSLLEGVSAGNDIPPSGIFPPNEDNQVDHTPLSIHSSNWTCAEENLDLTRTSVQEGTLADAQQHFSCSVAIGKLGIATADQRPSRLVVDNSVCGLNSRCKIPEHSTLPSAKDVIRCFPIRESQADLMGFSLDIKSAHKRIPIKESEQNLVGFTL